MDQIYAKAAWGPRHTSKIDYADRCRQFFQALADLDTATFTGWVIVGSQDSIPLSVESIQSRMEGVDEFSLSAYVDSQDELFVRFNGTDGTGNANEVTLDVYEGGPSAPLTESLRRWWMSRAPAIMEALVRIWAPDCASIGTYQIATGGRDPDDDIHRDQDGDEDLEHEEAEVPEVGILTYLSPGRAAHVPSNLNVRKSPTPDGGVIISLPDPQPKQDWKAAMVQSAQSLTVELRGTAALAPIPEDRARVGDEPVAAAAHIFPVDSSWDPSKDQVTLRAMWGPRHTTAAECALRWVEFLRKLRDIDAELFSGWAAEKLADDDVLMAPFTITVDGVLEAMGSGRHWWSSDTYGMSAQIEHNWATVDFTTLDGGTDRHPADQNHASIKILVGDEWMAPLAELYSRAWAKIGLRAMEAVIECWEPDHALLGSLAISEAQRLPDSGNGDPEVGILTYVSSARAAHLPTNLNAPTTTTADGGVIIGLPEPQPGKDWTTATIRNAASLAAKLRQTHAFAPLPTDRPHL